MLRQGVYILMAALFALEWSTSKYPLSAVVRASSVNDIDSYEQKQRQNFIDHFIRIARDKNVMGSAQSPDGKVIEDPNKSRLNKDNKNNFRSDLTYHAAPVSVEIPQNPTPSNGGNKGNAANPSQPNFDTIQAFISTHGKEQAALSSSQLERTAWEVNKAKEEAQKKAKATGSKAALNSQEPEKVGMFQIETRQAKNSQGTGGAGNAGGGSGTGVQTTPRASDIPVERWTMVGDARKKMEEVGTQSFEQTIVKSARDQGAQNDATKMGTLPLYYNVAQRALRSMWNASLAYLAERRANKNIDPFVAGASSQAIAPTLTEATPTCQAWQQQMEQQLAQAKNASPEEIDQLRKEIKRSQQDCSAMVKAKYSTINPQIRAQSQAPGGSSGPTGTGQGSGSLKSEGPQYEDGRERDLRVQLAVLQKAGIDPNNVPSNWKYSRGDASAPVSLSVDSQGQPSNPVNLSVAEQLQYYNRDLKEVPKSYQEVQKRFSNLSAPPDLSQYEIRPGQKAVTEITKIPDAVYRDEMGMAPPPNQPLPETYDELQSSSN